MIPKQILTSQYHSIPINLMFSVHSQHYEKYSNFEDDVLLALTLDDVYEWISDKFYSTPTPTVYENPTKGWA